MFSNFFINYKTAVIKCPKIVFLDLTNNHYTVSPAGLEVLPLWAASGVGRPRPRLYKGWAAWNTISLQLDADRVRRLVTHGRQHVSL